jgi:hypothetical protein
MAEIWPKFGRKMAKKSRKKSRDEAPISIDTTAHFARKLVKKVFSSRRKDTKIALLKIKAR